MTVRSGLVGWGILAVAGLFALASTLPPVPRAATGEAVDRFFDRYVSESGRVSRPEGDTVSEGQAYALLMAAATHRPDRFASVWDWTRRHLLRSDGAMAWLWDGEVVDEAVAPDADVDATVALYLAAERFRRPAYGRAARRMADAVADAAAVRSGTDLHLSAGEWAKDPQVVINPSYLDPASFGFLAEKTGDRRWDRLERSARRTLSAMVSGSLPPDWAILEPGGIQPVASPDERGEPGGFGFEAVRVPVRLATDCTASLMKGMEPVWPEVARRPGVAVRHLDGRAAAGWTHPVGFVASAALAHSADPSRVDELLDRATQAERRDPSYYGAAWVALGRLLLTTSKLDRCP